MTTLSEQQIKRTEFLMDALYKTLTGQRLSVYLAAQCAKYEELKDKDVQKAVLDQAGKNAVNILRVQFEELKKIMDDPEQIAKLKASVLPKAEN